MWFSIAIGAVIALSIFKSFKHLTRSQWGSRTTATQAAEGADLSRHVIAITGPSAGIGQHTAKVLLTKGATVMLLARDLSKLNKVVDAMELTSEQRSRGIVIECDLDSLASVRTAARKIKSFLTEKNFKLNTLVNNAGISMQTFTTSKDGYESVFATNHLGHYYLAALLAPLMGPVPSASSALLREPRIIVLASDVQRLFWPRFKIKLQDVIRDGLKHLEGKEAKEQALNKSGQPLSEKFDGTRQYSFSKALNVIYARHLHRVLQQDRGVKVVSVHPGFIKTELARSAPTHLKVIMDTMRVILGVFWDNVKNIPQGAATTVRCVVLPDSELNGGHFYQDCNDANDWGVFTDLQEKNYGKEDEEALFQWSDALITGKGFSMKLE